MVNSIEITRQSFSKRLGEIIDSVLGDARIKELMETVPHQDSENRGIPTGEIALKMGVITPGTKNALLVAQAAERTFQLARAGEHIALSHDRSVEAKDGTVGKDLYKSLSDDVFKFVGSPRDPAIVQVAQATWMAAQAWVNNEIGAIDDEVDHPRCDANARTLGPEAAEPFRKAAVSFYSVASCMLADAGHVSASEKLRAVSDDLSGTIGITSGQNYFKSPQEVVARLNLNSIQGNNDLALSLNDERYAEHTSENDNYDKLIGLLNQRAELVQPQRPANRVEIRGEQLKK